MQQRPAQRVADLARELGRDPGTLRRWATRHLAEADVERRARPGGGAPELWVSPAGSDAIRRAYTPGAPSDQAEPGQPASGPTPGAPSDAGWREAVAQLRAELDAARSQLRVATQQRDAALQRVGDAERAHWATAERLASLRASVAIWYAAASTRPWWRRARGLPPLPADVTGNEPRLARPGQGS